MSAVCLLLPAVTSCSCSTVCFGLNASSLSAVYQLLSAVASCCCNDWFGMVECQQFVSCLSTVISCCKLLLDRLVWYGLTASFVSCFIIYDQLLPAVARMAGFSGLVWLEMPVCQLFISCYQLLLEWLVWYGWNASISTAGCTPVLDLVGGSLNA